VIGDEPNRLKAGENQVRKGRPDHWTAEAHSEAKAARFKGADYHEAAPFEAAATGTPLLE